MTNPNERAVFRDYPIGVWFTGLIALTVAIISFIAQERRQGFVVALIGFVIIAFGSIMTVAVDERREILNLYYRSLVRASIKTYPFRDIAFVNVAEDSEGERMHRLELILHSGETIPLRSGYLAGKSIQERKAQRLRSALRMSGEVIIT